MSNGDNWISKQSDSQIPKRGTTGNASRGYDMIKKMYQLCVKENTEINETKNTDNVFNGPTSSSISSLNLFNRVMLLTRRLQDAYRRNTPLQDHMRKALEMLDNAQRAQNRVTGGSVGELGRRRGFSWPETAPEQTSEQEKAIIERFMRNYQRAKKVRAFVNGYDDHREALKNEVSLDQLRAMHSFIQTFLDGMKSQPLGQQSAMAAKGKFKEFFESLLTEMSKEQGAYKSLGRQPKIALEYMTKWQKELAAFSKDIGQFSITTIEQLKEDLTSFLAKLEPSSLTILTPVTGIEPTGSLEEAKQTFCFEQLVATSDVLGKNLKALDFEVASNWDEVGQLEVPGENAKQYNERVKRLHPWIEEMKELLARQMNDGRRQVIGQYMAECKESILYLHGLISIHKDTIDIPDILRECDTKIDVMEKSKDASRAYRNIMQTKQETDAHWARSSLEVRSQMSAYFARCLKSLESYRLAFDQFFEDQQAERKKILNRDSTTRINTELPTLCKNMVNINNEMIRAIDILTLREKEAKSTLSEDERKELQEHKNESKRYWERTEIFINKSRIDRIFKNYQHDSHNKLLAGLDRNAYLKELHEGRIGFRDRYTCGEHAEKRLRLFESCYGNKPWKSSLLTKNEFRLLLALKDIGKSEAFKRDGRSLGANECIRRLLPKMLQWLEIPKEKGEIILSLATQSYLDEYMDYLDIARYAKHLSSEAARLGIATREYFDLATLLYKCDAGSNDQLTKMNFSQQTQEAFGQLADRISAGQDNVRLDLNWVIDTGIDTGIAVGGSFTSGQIESLKQEIMNVVDVREERCDDAEALACAGIKLLHLPAPDRHALSVEQLVEGTKWVLACRERGERVLIHCEFGMGRSVLLAAAVLVARGKTAQEALESIQKNRPQARLNLPQFERLQEFEDHWKQLQLVRANTAYPKPDYLTEPARHLVLDTLQQGDRNRALTYAQQALSLREAANFKTNLPLDHLLLSTIYQAKGDTTNALLHAQKASAIAKGLPKNKSSQDDTYRPSHPNETIKNLEVPKASAIASEMGIDDAVVLADKQLERINKKDGYQTFSLNAARSFIAAYNNLKYVYDNSSILQTSDKYLRDPEKLPSLKILEDMHRDLMKLPEQGKELEPSQEGAQEQGLPAFTLEQTQKLEKAMQDMKNAEGLPKAKTLGNDGGQLLQEIETLLDANSLPKAEMLESDGKQLLDNMEGLSKHIIQKRDQFEKVSRWISGGMQAHLDLEKAIESADAQLGPAKQDRHFSPNLNVSVRTYQEDLEAARSYKDQSDATTIKGLNERAKTLKAHQIRLDEALEKLTREEVEKWSKWSREAGDVEHMQPEHSMISTFDVADVLDFERVAEDLHMALQRKEPEGIYRELFALQWQLKAAEKLDAAYKRKYNDTVEIALKKHFGKPEQEGQLAHALQYLKPMELRPASLGTLHVELAKSTVVPETIYALLAPFQRGERWDIPESSYLRQLRIILEAAIEEKMEGPSKAYARFLLGDPELEKPARSLKEATRLGRAISGLLMNWDDGVSGPLPSDSALRADFACRALKKLGIASGKYFAHSVSFDTTGKARGNLRSPDPLASPDQKPEWYRVAARIQVKTSFGPRELLLDSKLSDRDRLWTLEEWMSQMGHDAFKCLSLEKYKAELERNPNFLYSDKRDKAYVVTMSRRYFKRPESDVIAAREARSNLISDDTTLESAKEVLIDTVDEVPYYNIAEFIWKNRHKFQDEASAEKLVTALSEKLLEQVRHFGFRFISHTTFSDAFPTLYQDLKTRLEETNVSASTMECFESLLSSTSIFSRAHRDQGSSSADTVRDVGIAEAASQQKELSEKFEQAKKAYITSRAKKLYDQTIEIVDSYRKTHTQEIQQIPIYFKICMRNLENCYSEIQKCARGGSDSSTLSQKFDNLLKANKEVKNAMIPIIEAGKRFPTARDVFNAFKPSEELLEGFEKHSRQHWEEKAKERLRKELDEKLGKKITDGEFEKYCEENFEDYHQKYLKDLDEHALDLVKPEDTEMRIRRPAHEILKILQRGRIVSVFEAQTISDQTLRVMTRRHAKRQKELYGFPRDLPAALRLLFMAVTKGFYTGRSSLESYGAASIKIKPSVQRRATKVMYNSAWVAPEGTPGAFLAARSVPFNEPGRDCFPLTDPVSVVNDPNATMDEKKNARTFFSKKDPLEFATLNDITPYVEGHAQGLTLDDIERIDFSERFDYELMEGLDKIVSDKQKEALREILSDAEKNEIKNIEKKGFIGVMRDILSRQESDQINEALLEMYNNSRKALIQKAKEDKQNMIAQLDEWGIAYSLNSSGSREDAVASEFVAASSSGDQGPQVLLPQDVEKKLLTLVGIKPDVERALKQEPFSPKAIDLLKQNSYFKELCEGDTGVREGYKLQEHIEMLVGQFKKYFATTWNNPEQWVEDAAPLTVQEFCLMLIVSDIGKPLAFKETGGTSAQHEYTRCLVPSILKALGIPEKRASIILSLATQDYIGGDYLQQRQRPEVVAKRIAEEAQRLGMPKQDYFQLVTIYYMCDAGAYTADAEYSDAEGEKRKGKPSLDYHFLFHRDVDGNPTTMSFSPHTQVKFDRLADHMIELHYLVDVLKDSTKLSTNEGASTT